MKRIYFLSILIILLTTESTAQSFGKHNFLTDTAEKIISKYYGSEFLGKYIVLDSNSSFYMLNEDRTFKESVEINRKPTFNPNSLLFTYNFFHPHFNGDTLNVSFMLDSTGEFNNEYFLLSSLVKFEHKPLIERNSIKKSISKKLGNQHSLKSINLSWSIVEYYKLTQKKKGLKKEKIIWLVTLTNNQNQDKNIAFDAYTGKRIWTIKTTANNGYK